MLAVTYSFFHIFPPKAVTNNCTAVYFVVFCYVQRRVTLRLQKVIFLLAFGCQIASDNSRDKIIRDKKKIIN